MREIFRRCGTRTAEAVGSPMVSAMVALESSSDEELAALQAEFERRHQRLVEHERQRRAGGDRGRHAA